MSYIFINYSREDQNFVKILIDKLIEQGFEVWMDLRSISFGNQWFDAIAQAIENCSAMIVVVSPTSNASEWVKREAQLALRQEKPIFPILLAGTTPSFLAHIQSVDCRNGQMPPDKFYEVLALMVPRKGNKRAIPAEASLSSNSSDMQQEQKQIERQVNGDLQPLFAALKSAVEPLKSQISLQAETIDKLNRRLDEVLISIQEQRSGKRIDRQTEHVTAFVAMPFAGYEPLYRSLQAVLEDLPYAWEVINAAERYGEPTIDKNIKWHMEQAHCYLAEITDGNANVFYELGLMHGIFEDRPVILLRREDAPKKFADLDGMIYIHYPPFDVTNPNIQDIKLALSNQFSRYKQLSSLRDSTRKHFLSSIIWLGVHPVEVVTKVCEVYKTAEDFVGASIAEIIDICRLQDWEGTVHDFQRHVKNFYGLK